MVGGRAVGGLSLGAFCLGVFVTLQISPRFAPVGQSSHPLSGSKASVEVLPQANEQVPGWLFERLFHEEAIRCPWLEPGQPADSSCERRASEIQSLRNALAVCEDPFRRTNRVIGHRGAPLVAPEETVQSWSIGVQSGAGAVECDVSVTKNLDFVCRHSTCDLHTTTDIIANHPDLNAKCTQPFTPGSGTAPECCTYDFTTTELQRLCALMDAEKGNNSATTYAGYWTGAPAFRSGADGLERCHSIVRYDDYLKLLQQSGYNVIPELKDTYKTGMTAFLDKNNMTWVDLADTFAAMIESYGFTSDGPGLTATMQTFDRNVAEHWKLTRPHMRVEYMWKTANRGTRCWKPDDCGTRSEIEYLFGLGVDLFSPPINILLAATDDRRIVPSWSAVMLRDVGANIGTWSLERQGCSSGGPQKQPDAPAPCADRMAITGYYGPLEGKATFQHVDTLRVLDALFRDVGISSIFSDFPATPTAYVNCVLEAKAVAGVQVVA